MAVESLQGRDYFNQGTGETPVLKLKDRGVILSLKSLPANGELAIKTRVAKFKLRIHPEASGFRLDEPENCKVLVAIGPSGPDSDVYAQGPLVLSQNAVPDCSYVQSTVAHIYHRYNNQAGLCLNVVEQRETGEPLLEIKAITPYHQRLKEYKPLDLADFPDIYS